MIFESRLATGVNGYNVLRDEGYPIPSYRTLCSRISSIDFVPGIQYNILRLLQEQLTSTERNVSLVLDEMKIKKFIDYDKSK